MCRYILPLPADTITPVPQGIFDTRGLCQIQSLENHMKVIPSIQNQAKAKDLMHEGQGLISVHMIQCFNLIEN